MIYSTYMMSRYHEECQELPNPHTGGVGVAGSNPVVPTNFSLDDPD